MRVLSSSPSDAVRPTAGDTVLDLLLTGMSAIASTLPQVRQQLRDWARTAGLDAATLDDVGLATYEAMANVVDHAYDQPGGLFDVHAYRRDGLVTVTVTDHGRYKPPGGTQSLRGRGLLLIEGVAARFELIPLAVGTRVRMSWPVSG